MCFEPQESRRTVNISTQITGFLDGSGVYGSDAEDAAELRQFSGGRLKAYSPAGQAGRVLLPQEEGEAKEECEIAESEQQLDRKCFRAGQYLYWIT